jgi:hypothetical protein
MSGADAHFTHLIESAILQIRALCDEAPAGRSLIVLVDPVLSDTVETLPGFEDCRRMPLAISHPDIDRASTPFLIEIEDAEKQERFLNQTIHLAVHEALDVDAAGGKRARSLCGWLLSAAPLAELSQTLGRHGLVIDQEGKFRIFRFWDPRVLQHLARDSAMAALLPAIEATSWTTIDSFGMAQTIQLPAPGRTDRGRPGLDHGGRLMLTRPQQKALQELSLVNAVFEARQLFLQAPDNGIWAELAGHVACADRVGLRQAADCIGFAGDRYAMRAPIERSDEMAELLGHVAQSGIAYAALAAELDDGDWERIVEQARQAQMPHEDRAMHTNTAMP